MANQTETKVDTVVKVVLVFFVCLLSFSVGTYVGKRFSDHQNKIAQLSGKDHQDIKQELESLEVLSESVEAKASDNEAMTSEDVAKLAASLDQAKSETIDISQLNKNSQEREIASTEKNESNSSEMRPTAASKVNTPLATKSTVTPADQAKQIESQYSGKFTIQIGSFPTEAEAEKLTSELNKKGIAAFYVTAKVPDKKDESIVKTWYRVNIGLYASAKEAEESKNELILSKSITNGFVQKMN